MTYEFDSFTRISRQYIGNIQENGINDLAGKLQTPLFKLRPTAGEQIKLEFKLVDQVQRNADQEVHEFFQRNV